MLKKDMQLFDAAGAWSPVAAGSPSAKEDKRHKIKMTFGQKLNYQVPSPTGGVKIFQSQDKRGLAQLCLHK